jgi:hypothetical protein
LSRSHSAAGGTATPRWTSSASERYAAFRTRMFPSSRGNTSCPPAREAGTSVKTAASVFARSSRPAGLRSSPLRGTACSGRRRPNSDHLLRGLQRVAGAASCRLADPMSAAWSTAALRTGTAPLLAGAGTDACFPPISTRPTLNSFRSASSRVPCSESQTSIASFSASLAGGRGHGPSQA